MEIISVFSKNLDGKFIQSNFAVREWYCKPTILSSLCHYLNSKDENVVLITCSKYGCRQFLPCDSDNFHIHDIIEYDYKKNLPYYVIVF